MPLYDAYRRRVDETLKFVDERHARPGSVPFPPAAEIPFPRVVVDGAGEEWSYVRTLDTDTGELSYYARAGGRFLMDPASGWIKTVTTFVPLPVEILPYATEEVPE